MALQQQLDPPLTPALARIMKGDLCSGCGACAALAPHAIQMQEVKPGYLRPVQKAALETSHDAEIAAICPGLGQNVNAGQRQDDPLWGPYVAVYEGFATNPELRFAGASGGGLSGLAVWLLESGQVEAILHIKADPEQAVGNIATLSRTRKEVMEGAGSRYAPAAPLAALHEIPDDLSRIAFIGKPCDAAAMRSMCARYPALAQRFPIILSFFCAGTPSLTGAEAVLAALETPSEEAALFRYRGNGWPGLATVTRQDGSVATMSYHDSWGKILSKHVQHRCKICADGTGVAADIAYADAWESDADGYPIFEEREGVSLIVSRTALGADLLSSAQEAGAITLAPFDVSALAGMQPGQRTRRQVLAARLAALRVLGKPTPRYHGLQIAAAARQASFVSLARNFLGTLRRALTR